MEILKAAESDSSRLKSFFERTVLPGTIDFSIERSASFFDQYRLLSDDHETLMMIDEKTGELAGVASVIFREGFVRGEKQVWGYATDLRIASTRRAISQWAQLFLPELERACEERRCRYVFAAVQSSDNQAYNALIRPTSHSRRKLPRYHLVNRFRIINLHGRVPFAAAPLSSIRLAEAKPDDLEPLCAYLRDRALFRPLGQIHTPQNLLMEIARWPGLSLGDFQILRDSRGKILGCGALWDPRGIQTYIPRSYNGLAGTLQGTLRLGSFTGLVRALPHLGEPMPVRYLTHLCCDTPDAFHRLVDDAFGRLQKREFLSYLHFRGNWRTLPPAAFFASSLPYGFYLVLPPHRDAPDLRANVFAGAEPSNPLTILPPEFELAWL